MEALGHALADVRVVPTVVVDGAEAVIDPSLAVGAQDALIGDAEALDDGEHVLPAVEGAHDSLDRLVVERRALEVGAVVVVGLVEIDDGLGLAHGLDEEGVVGPAGARVLGEADALLVEEAPAVDRRPDGGVLRDELGLLAHRDRTRGGLDLALHSGGERRLAVGVVPVADIGPGGLHDVEGLGEGVREREHVGVHAGVNPIVGLDDGDPVALGHAQAHVAALAVAAVGLVDHDDARVGHGVGADDVGAAVG